MNALAASVCTHCGLPVRIVRILSPREADEAIFCCYGCEVAFHLLGSGDEAGARLAMYKLAAGVVLGINVMMFSMPLYVESLGSFFRQGFGSDSFFELLKWLLMVLSLPVYFLLGTPFIESSVRNIKAGLRSNADLLIAVGVTAAMLVSIFDTIFTNGPVYYETAVAILVIVTAGRYLEAKARAKASLAVDALDAQIPSTVSVLTNGITREKQVAALLPGEIILSKPGEMIPVDTLIKNGTARISEAMLTGEPNPIERGVGEILLAGAINYDGLLQLEVIHRAEESFISRLKVLLLESKLKRAKIQDVADRVASIAVPMILLLALGSFGYWWIAQDLRHGLFAFLSVVLVACPCAIGIATPAALWVAVTEASKHGILFRSLGVVERLALVKKIFFDKTGTLTVGMPGISGVSVIRAGENDLSRFLPYITAVASISSHPLSKAIAAKYSDIYDSLRATDVLEVPSQGIMGIVDGRKIRIGSEVFINRVALLDTQVSSAWCSIIEPDTTETILEFTFEDTIKPETMEVFQGLHSGGYATGILSGDTTLIAEALGRNLHSEAFGKLTPEDKARLVSEEPNVAFVGDGFNDAGAIGAAQVGIAIGSGSDLIRSEADVILFDNDLRRVPELLSLAKRTMRIVKQNLFWAFAYNVIGVVIAAMGLLNPIVAAMAMALSSLAVAQNSLRLRGRMEVSGG